MAPIWFQRVLLQTVPIPECTKMCVLKCNLRVRVHSNGVYADDYVSYAGGQQVRSAPRGGPRGGALPRQNMRGRGSWRQSAEPLKFESDFDFESSNAQFDKEEIEKELKQKLTIGGGKLEDCSTCAVNVFKDIIPKVNEYFPSFP